ncbi:cholesterol side-chain cleavage enzyme, mitochondrial-like isoform X2 [Haliotis asinina]|uniref:cholesterol side-chain cleavage enzyme, mitochondrial-like isoform X2 n=1 Tax=Haliotis asinina TaxID=109174 RepID=UPI0035325347
MHLQLTLTAEATSEVLLYSKAKYTVETAHLLYNALVNQYGPLVRVRLGEWVVLVSDVGDMETVMRSEGRYPRRMEPYINVLHCEKYDIPKGVGSLEGEEWHKYRSPLNARMMKIHSAHQYLPVQNEVADDLVAQIKLGKIQKDGALELFFRYACESISVIAYNKRLGYLSPNIENDPSKLQDLKDIQTMFKLMNETLTIPHILLKALPWKAKREYNSAANRIISHATDYYSNTLANIKQRQNDGVVDENNFMMSLLMLDKLSIEEMGSVAFELFSSGTESTARNLQMVLYYLARNPDKQNKLFQEVIETIGPRAPLTTEALGKMKYIFACMKESFRLAYPILSGPQRYIATDIVLQGYRIPAGTSVAMMNQKVAKDEKYFPNPEAFLPERWLRDETGRRMVPIPSSAVLPFGFGPRQCLGRRFAEQEIDLALTKIVQHFQVDLEHGHEDVELRYRIFVGTKHPIRFIFRTRS